MTEQIKRLYSMSDAIMLEKASVMHAALVDSLADFTNYTTLFDQTYADDWMAEIMVALQTPTAEQVGDMGSSYTQVVLEKMAECRKAFGGMKFFVREAFPNNVGVQNEFGFDDYAEARNKQPLMVYFMQRLHFTATKYANQLLAAGCPQARIDGLQALANQLFVVNVEQEAFLKNRPNSTAERITILNNVWKQLIRVSEAGKVIYADNYAGYRKYVIYGSRAVVDDEEVFEGVLQGGETVEVFSKPFSANRNLMLGNPGNVAVEYFFSLKDDNPVDKVFVVNPGDLLTLLHGDIGQSGGRFMARNTDPVSIAEYNVTALSQS